MIPEELDRFFARQADFDAVLQRIQSQPIELPVQFTRILCDACGYPSVTTSPYDYCSVCDWEQEPEHYWKMVDPDEPSGGPNGPYSLTEARVNFERYGSMFSPDDPDVNYERVQQEIEGKKPQVAAYKRLQVARTTREIIAAVVHIREVEGPGTYVDYKPDEPHDDQKSAT